MTRCPNPLVALLVLSVVVISAVGEPAIGTWAFLSGAQGSLVSTFPSALSTVGASVDVSTVSLPGSYLGASTSDPVSGDVYFQGGGYLSSSLFSPPAIYKLTGGAPSSGALPTITHVTGGTTSTTYPTYPPNKFQPSSAYSPGSRQGAGMTFYKGVIYVYGGQISSTLFTDDVWAYDIPSGNWTWLFGSSSSTTSVAPLWGAFGQETVGVYPGGRTQFGYWNDPQGNIYMFAGAPISGVRPSDLWRFNTTSYLWTWLAGSSSNWNAGSYGPIGQSSSSYYPSSRYSIGTCFQQNKAFMFGGTYLPANTDQSLGDLWMYDMSSNNFTLLAGQLSNGDTNPTYGAQFIDDAATTTGTRRESACSVDANGDVWIFGGWNGNVGFMADLLRFSLKSMNFAWFYKTTAVSYTSYGVYSDQAQSTGKAGHLQFMVNSQLCIFGGKYTAATDELWCYKFCTRNSSMLDCNGCGPGQYLNVTTSACQSCPANTSLSFSGAKSSTAVTLCPSCPAFSFTSTSSPSTCMTCPPGTQVMGTASSAYCVNCDAGKFSSTSNSTTCTACASGTTSSSGAASCTTPSPTAKKGAVAASLRISLVPLLLLLVVLAFPH